MMFISEPSRILDAYRVSQTAWANNIQSYAQELFGALAAIEFTWSAAVMVLEKSDMQAWTAALVRKIMWIGAFYMLLINGATWIPAIIRSFETVGQQVSGVPIMVPSDIFEQGLNIAGTLLSATSIAGFMTDLSGSLALVVCALGIVGAFTVITVQFIVAVVESYIVISAGLVLLGFGGSRWTVSYVEKYIGLSISIGIKILTIYVVIAAGSSLSTEWLKTAAQIGTSKAPATAALEILGACLIYMMLCLQIPKLFSAVLGGAPALSGADAAGTAALIAGAAAATGSMVAKSAQAVASTGGRAISAVDAAFFSSAGAPNASATKISSPHGGPGNLDSASHVVAPVQPPQTLDGITDSKGTRSIDAGQNAVGPPRISGLPSGHGPPTTRVEEAPHSKQGKTSRKPDNHPGT